VDRALRALSTLDLGPSYVIRVEPPDGAVGTLTDAPVLMRLSHRIDPGSLSPAAVSVRDPFGPVPARLELSLDGRVVIWRPERPLLPCLEHRLELCGLLDFRGREVRPYVSRFVPGSLSFGDLASPPEEEAC
jgi:hypothetical protein